MREPHKSIHMGSIDLVVMKRGEWKMAAQTGVCAAICVMP
jgi:hypothetical protein